MRRKAMRRWGLLLLLLLLGLGCRESRRSAPAVVDGVEPPPAAPVGLDVPLDVAAPADVASAEASAEAESEVSKPPLPPLGAARDAGSDGGPALFPRRCDLQPGTVPGPPPRGRMGVDGGIRREEGSGRMSPETIAQWLQRLRPSFEICLGLAQTCEPALAGRLVFDLVVDTDGSVDAQIRSADPRLHDAGVLNCVLQRLRRHRFATGAPPDAPAVFQVPLRFLPRP